MTLHCIWDQSYALVSQITEFLHLIQIPVVRIHAVSALEFLQDPNPDSPVTSAFLSLMAKDNSPEVRRCILNKIALTDGSLSGQYI